MRKNKKIKRIKKNVIELSLHYKLDIIRPYSDPWKFVNLLDFALFLHKDDLKHAQYKS